jgi:L-serine dehydratase
MELLSFTTASQLLELCDEKSLSIADIVLEYSMQQHQLSKEEVLFEMQKRLDVMKESVAKGVVISDRSPSGLSGGDAKKIASYRPENPLLNAFSLKAVGYAFAVMEHNARYGRVVAFPTAGSAGVVPGVLLAYQDSFSIPDTDIIKAMLVAGGIGIITGENAMMSGATGGCQSEVGTSTAMAAAGLTEIRGGTPKQSLDAASISLKVMLGLVCDPMGGLVESPCVKRNASGVTNALLASEMVLAGVESNVSFDEVLVAMVNIAELMAEELRETAKGGLGCTQTGRKIWSIVNSGTIQ